MLKSTFFDLLAKRTLKGIKVIKQTHRKDKVRFYQYITVGENFQTYESKPHEDFFVSPFKKRNSAQILFRHIIQIGYQNSKSEENFKTILVKSPYLVKSFKQKIIQKIFGIYTFTQQGRLLKQEIQNEIIKLERELPELINTDKQKALDILKAIGGNILLLITIDFALLNQIDKELLREINKRNNNSSFSGCGATWDSLESYSTNFDSTSDSFDFGGGDFGGAGAGGSFCSGCSGCSGCGGGCGGIN